MRWIALADMAGTHPHIIIDPDGHRCLCLALRCARADMPPVLAEHAHMEAVDQALTGIGRVWDARTGRAVA